MIAAGCASGAFQHASPAEAAAAIIATIQGYFVLAAVSRELVPRGSAHRLLGAATYRHRPFASTLGTLLRIPTIVISRSDHRDHEQGS